MIFAEAHNKFQQIAFNLSRLAGDTNHTNPFVFICATSVLEYLARIVYNKEAQGPDFVEFVNNYLARVNITYKTFQYVTHSDVLAEQMWYILRNGIVHSYSLVPSANYPKGRSGSVVLSHRINGPAHLSQYTQKGYDACNFVAEDFAEDINKLVEIIFADTTLITNVEDWTQRHPPIGWLENAPSHPLTVAPDSRFRNQPR